MADSNGNGREAGSESQEDSELREDMPPSHFRSIITYATFLNDYMKVLLLFIPVGLITGALGAPGAVVFIFNFIPLIQLAAVIDLATEDLVSSAGVVLGGLLSILAYNPVEMIISIIAVTRGQLRVAQASLIGSILSYSLLILGSSFWLAGYGRESLNFNDTATSILEASMMLVSISLIVPSVTSTTLSQPNSPESREDFNAHDMLMLSHGTAIVLIITLAIYLYFRLKSHEVFLDREANTRNAPNGDNSRRTTPEAAPVLGPAAAACVLVAAILCTVSCSYYLVDSIDGFATSIHMGKIFISIILIPFAGNASRYTGIMTMARRNKPASAVKAVISSVLLITLLVIPSAVLLGWIIDQPMALDFTTFEATIFILAILVVNSVVQRGKASYFEGVMLVGTYIVIAVAFYLRPDTEDTSIATS